MGLIRKAKMCDVPQIQNIIESFAKRGEMLPRSLLELYENLRDFFVYEENSQGTVGVCSLHFGWENLAEIRSLAVKDTFQNRGIGAKLVRVCISEARAFGIRRIFSLTYKPEYFLKFGFKSIEKELLPQKIWSDCMRCPEFPKCNEVAISLDLERPFIEDAYQIPLITAGNNEKQDN
ncbi:MAG TPA: N-acetyltransferase [bacterium]